MTVDRSAPDFDLWGEDPEFPKGDWVMEVNNNETVLGYWDWVDHQREADEEDAEE